MDSYIMKPGSAHEVSRFIQVQDGDDNDEGTLSLMTVSLSQATPFTYTLAKFQDHRKIMEMEQVRNHEEDEEEYNIRQLKLMQDSQFNAKYVAFNRAKLPYEVHYNGVFVLNVLEGGASDGILKAGDEIISVNGNPIEKQDDLIKILANKGLDYKVDLVIVRNDEKVDLTTKLKKIPESKEGRVGLGITYTESKSITTTPKVTVKTENIGGPSAGLMFTLEILNQLVDEDVTKGYNIAGTGEMNVDGTVGRIGGIDMKVIAADEDGMEIFFAPDDTISAEAKASNPSLESNYTVASRTAKEIGTKMKIIPVKTIDDALTYLEGLEPK